MLNKEEKVKLEVKNSELKEIEGIVEEKKADKIRIENKIEELEAEIREI